MLVDDAAADEGGRPLGRLVRPLRAARSLDDPRAARRPSRGTPGRRARDLDGGLGRGHGVPPWRGQRAHARLVRADARGRPAGSRPPGPDPARLRRLRRRRGVPLPARPDPRRRVSVAVEGHRAPTCTSASPPGSSARPGTGCASSRRSSATTWSRRFDTAPRSARSTHTRPRSRPERRSGSRRQVDGRWPAATFPRRSACSSGPGSLVPRRTETCSGSPGARGCADRGRLVERCRARA